MQESHIQFDPSPKKEMANSEKMKDVIQDVIDGTFFLFNTETMADYDADFREEEPYFIHIWNKERGKGFGYLVFHDFLRRVGVEKTFVSTDFTGDGRKLFEKAVQDGLITKEPHFVSLQRLTRWKVVGDPVEHLRRMKDSLAV